MVAPVRPEDVLPSGVETIVLNGTEVRKGSVAAFVANVRLLDTVQADSAEAGEVAAQLGALVPALRAAGVLDVFTPRSAVVAAIIAAH